MLSAIVIVGAEIREEEESGIAANQAAPTFSLASATSKVQPGTPLVCVEVLGRSVAGRLIEELRRASVDRIAMLGNVFETSACAGSDSSAGDSSSTIDSMEEAKGGLTEELWRNATEQFLAYKESDFEAILVTRLGAYVDLDLKDAFQFHREQGQGVTRAFSNANGTTLDFWIVDPAQVNDDMDLMTTLRSAEPARYQVSGYVNRLEHPRDLRRLVVDGLTSRCGLRPQGVETRPGVWMDEGAHVHRDARIVAPAFIGRGARIGEQCLITRCSNVESNCQVDYGTVVEDSSVLSNSYVGIGLDLSHSIVDGTNLMNLERGVTLEIADPCVIRQNRVPDQNKSFESPAAFGLGGVQLSPVEDFALGMDCTNANS